MSRPRAIGAELDGTDRELRAQNGLLAEKESRAGALRQMIESGEGLGEGTQAVLRGLDNADFFKPAIAGVLASHIRVETDDVAAVEAAFGQNLQSIVMKDAMVAEVGRQNPLREAMGPRPTHPARASGDARPLPDEAAPEGTARLGARSREDATPRWPRWSRCCWAVSPSSRTSIPRLRLAREQLQAPPEQRCDFVTVTGELVTRQGILTGGRAKGENAGAAVLHRKNQIAALEEQAAGNPRESRRPRPPPAKRPPRGSTPPGTGSPRPARKPRSSPSPSPPAAENCSSSSARSARRPRNSNP